MVKKIIGYLVALIGLAGLGFTSFSDLSKLPFTLPAFVQAKYVMIASIILVVLGIVISMQDKGGKQPSEVPIYEGHGKKRTIVGYQRMGK